MPFFLCPCCGESYLVPLAFCEFVFEKHDSEGWNGTIAPARCVACQASVSQGDTVALRTGRGLWQGPEQGKKDFPAGSKGTVIEVSTWNGEGSIFLLRLESGDEVYATRAQISPQ